MFKMKENALQTYALERNLLNRQYIYSLLDQGAELISQTTRLTHSQNVEVPFFLILTLQNAAIKLQLLFKLVYKVV